MTNRGTIPGLNSFVWQSYVPQWRANRFALNGAVATQPAIGNGAITGRYLKLGSGFVIANIEVNFGSTTTFGSIADFWQFSLPFPGSRAFGGADLPIGTGLATQGTLAAPQSTQEVTPTLADPGDVNQRWGNNSDEDNWLQAFCSQIIATGVGGDANSPLFTSGLASVVVTHNLGVVTGYVPNAYDINAMATNNPSTNPKTIYVDTITATTFTLHVGTSSTTTPLTYSWKIRAEPNSSGPSILVGPGAPWVWSTTGSLGFQAIYEARR